MTDSNKINNLESLNALIDRYFDGVSTPDDEQWLRRLLTADATEAPDFEIDAATAERLRQALAVISFSMAATEAQAAQQAPQQVKPMRWRAIASVAAAVAVVIALGVYLLIGGTGSSIQDAETQYLAYVDGNVIDDPDRVLALMHDELSDLKQESKEPEAAFENQLNDIRQGLMEIDDKDINTENSH